jgi:AraC-like DNA-binding protein
MVKQGHTEKNLSPPIKKAKDYIFLHLHSALTVAEISAHVGLSTNYLSALFKKETGKTIVAHIREKRIDAAKKLLVYSEYSANEIANHLTFSSQSHFISVFKKETGQTPQKYRQRYFAVNVTSSKGDE